MYSSETKIEISLETEKESHYPIFLCGLPNCIKYRKEDGRQETHRGKTLRSNVTYYTHT